MAAATPSTHVSSGLPSGLNPLPPTMIKPLAAGLIIGLLAISSWLFWLYLQTPPPSPQAKTQVSSDPSPTPSLANSQHYHVQPGDTLMLIAQKVYGDAQAWTTIAEANQLPRDHAESAHLYPGQQLFIPLSARTTRPLPQTHSSALPTDYLIATGDTLWSIAEAYYGQGQQWVIIFNHPANHLGRLANGQPLIHSGNHLYLPLTLPGTGIASRLL